MEENNSQEYEAAAYAQTAKMIQEGALNSGLGSEEVIKKIHTLSTSAIDRDLIANQKTTDSSVDE